MYRVLTKDNQDAWEVVKAKIIEENERLNFPPNLKPYSKPIPTIGEQYVSNTALTVFQDEVGYRGRTIIVKYNRVNLAILFRGFSVYRSKLTDSTISGFIEYLENSHIYLDKNCDFELVKDSNDEAVGFRIKAKPDNYLFYGEIQVDIIDVGNDLSKIVKNKIIHISPKGQLWVDQQWSASDYDQSERTINDLIYATRFCYTRGSDYSLYRYTILKDVFNNWDLLSKFETGKMVSDYSDEAGLLLTEIFKFWGHWYAYDYRRDTSDMSDFKAVINIAECKILYNGLNDEEHAKEFYRDAWHTHSIVLKPMHKRYTFLFTRHMTFFYFADLDRITEY